MTLGSLLRELRVRFGVVMPTRNGGPEGSPSPSAAQIQLIMHSLPGAAAYPAADRWADAGGVDYLYREYAILVRERDAERVAVALGHILYQAGYGNVPEGEAREILREPVTNGMVRLTVPRTPTLVPDLVARLDDTLGRGVATPDHILYRCPPSDPEEVPEGLPPDPGVSRESSDGDGALVAVLDSGLLYGATERHSWLAGVTGSQDYYGDPFRILPYVGHGTFVAGVVRTMAPKAGVRVEKAFHNVGAITEYELVNAVFETLDGGAEVILLPLGTYSRGDNPLLGFEVLVERVRNYPGCVLVAAAGNSGGTRPFWPAAFPWVVSVGALSGDRRSRASFSNYGAWVDVVAPGEGLVNAYAVGRYRCTVSADLGQWRSFDGMARWSGTAFSAALVAGLIAARMSRTGENGRMAAKSLLGAVQAQAIPGVGPVLPSSEPALQRALTGTWAGYRTGVRADLVLSGRLGHVSALVGVIEAFEDRGYEWFRVGGVGAGGCWRHS